MLHDLRYAWRALIKSPGFAAVAILTLALGIGANTAVFSIVNGVLLQPIPYKDPARLVAIWSKSIHESTLAKVFDSYTDFEDWTQHARSFELIAAETWATAGQVLTGRGPARQVTTIPVSDTFFALLGVPAARGRTFTPDDRNRGCTVVLSDRFWHAALGGDPKIVGRSIALDQRACTVAGIMPPAFAFYPEAAQVWTLITPDMTPKPNNFGVGIFGRLTPGVTREQAQAEVAALHKALHPADSWRDFVPIVYNLQDEFVWLAGRNLRATVWVLVAAVGLVLLIACLNVANLLLGRALAREHEIAIRAALGCGSTRLLRQFLTEALLLAAIAGALGTLLAYGAIRYFNAARPVELPVGASIALNIPVLLFTAALSIGTLLVFGLFPAWKSSRLDVNEALKSGGRGATSAASSHRIAKGLILAEVSLSVVLLLGAGLLMESVLRMGSEPLGFQPEHLITARITLPAGRYTSAAQKLQFYRELQQRIAAIRGVAGVTLTSALPNWRAGSQALRVQGRAVPQAYESHNVGSQSVDPAYFRVLGVRLLQGRSFDEHDQPDSERVAVINQALRQAYFRATDPIGQRVQLGDDGKGPWSTIVGVVANEKRANVLQEMNWSEDPVLFQPLAQEPASAFFLAAHTRAASASIGQEIQSVVSAIDPNLPLSDLEMLADRIGKILEYPRFRAVLLGAFAIFALLLAAVGLHGVLQQFVAQHRQEIGVRMALGARPENILALVAKQAGLPVALGLLLGIASALALGRYLASLLYGVRPANPVNLGLVALILAVAAALAMLVPAGRAARVDPMVALRQE